MGLNLRSLKNLSAVPVSDSGKGKSLPSPIEISREDMPNIFENTTSISKSVQENDIPATGPKISLMKLKKASWLENSIVITEESLKKEVEIECYSSDVGEIIQKEEIARAPSEEEIMVLSPSAELVITEETVYSSEESQSIILIEEKLETKDGEQENTKTPEIKEFFPNFQITDTMNLDEDLLDLQDFVTIKDHQKPIIDTGSILITEEISPIEVSVEASPVSSGESIIIQEITDISPVESSSEILSEESSNNIVVTPEYVAEVKTELSEARRAGFRFFLQKKTKIMAWVGIVALSISAIALFSGSFLETQVQKSGKSNIQETMQNGEISAGQGNIPPTETVAEIIPPTETITPVIPSLAEISNYEMGRDYSVTKNTKKNIQSKISTDSFTGTEIPTP